MRIISSKSILFIVLGAAVLTSFPTWAKDSSAVFGNLIDENKVMMFGSSEYENLKAYSSSVLDSTLIYKLQRQIAEQDQLIARLTNENVRLTNQNDLLTAMVSNLQRQVAESEPIRPALQSSNAEASAQNQTLEDAKYDELQKLCNQYAAEIERLRAEGNALKIENDSLRGIVDKINQETEQMSANNAKLMQKVNSAAMLIAHNVAVTPLKMNPKNNTGKETTRASAVNAIRIDGTLLDNNVVEPGKVVVYARIVSARNRLIVNFNEYGEPIDQYTDINGVRTLYTVSQDFDYTGESRSFSLTWNKMSDVTLEPGIYKVTLYANGNVIGTTTFRLK